jgi:prophage regulatory protein
MKMQKGSETPRFLRLGEVSARATLGKSTILAWEATGRFPRAVRLSANARVWLESDINDWIMAKRQEALEPFEALSVNR